MLARIVLRPKYKKIDRCPRCTQTKNEERRTRFQFKFTNPNVKCHCCSYPIPTQAYYYITPTYI